VAPSSCITGNGAYKETEVGHTANDIVGEVKDHEFRKSVRKGPVTRWRAPLVVSQLFTIALISRERLIADAWSKIPRK